MVAMETPRLLFFFLSKILMRRDCCDIKEVGKKLSIQSIKALYKTCYIHPFKNMHSYTDGRGCHARFLPCSSGVVQPFLTKAPLEISMLSHHHKLTHQWNSHSEQFKVRSYPKDTWTCNVEPGIKLPTC